MTLPTRADAGTEEHAGISTNGVKVPLHTRDGAANDPAVHTAASGDVFELAEALVAPDQDPIEQMNALLDQ